MHRFTPANPISSHYREHEAAALGRTFKRRIVIFLHKQLHIHKMGTFHLERDSLFQFLIHTTEERCRKLKGKKRERERHTHIIDFAGALMSLSCVYKKLKERIPF